mgnify:CR=1 FL=1
MAEEKNDLMEKIVSLCKRRGFIFQGSEIYGRLAGTWDFGPLGVALKQNLKALWWARFVSNRDDMYGVDAAILMNPAAWEASGHVAGFTDPLVDCKVSKNRYRADQLFFAAVVVAVATGAEGRGWRAIFRRGTAKDIPRGGETM